MRKKKIKMCRKIIEENCFDGSSIEEYDSLDRFDIRIYVPIEGDTVQGISKFKNINEIKIFDGGFYIYPTK